MIIFSAYPQSKPLGRGCRIIDRFLLGNAKKSIDNDPFGPVCTWQKYVKSTSWFQHLTWSTFLHQGTWQMACFCGNVWTLKVTVQMDSMDVVFADSWGSSQSSLVLKLLRSNWSFDESVLCDHPWWGLGLSDLQIWHKSFHLPMENKPWALNQFLAKFGPQAHERTLSTDILFGLLKEADLRDFFSGVLPDKNHSHQKGQMMESWIQAQVAIVICHHDCIRGVRVDPHGNLLPPWAATQVLQKRLEAQHWLSTTGQTTRNQNRWCFFRRRVQQPNTSKHIERCGNCQKNVKKKGFDILFASCCE